MSSLIALFAGIVFGLGLIVSQMTNPSKIIGFLTVGKHWDPSLVFVMISAIFVSYFAFAYAQRRRASFFNLDFEIPKRTEIDKQLIIGSALFGIGWGIVGYCPAPAITALFFGNPQTLLFVGAMLIGMYLFRVINK